MVNFIIKNKIVNSDDLKLFTHEGYAFCKEDEEKLLFIR